MNSIVAPPLVGGKFLIGSNNLFDPLVARFGLQLKRQGLELVGPCPKCGGRDRFAINLAKPAQSSGPSEWRQTVAECLRWPELLSPKEINFLSNVRRQSKLTDKQADWLEAIVERVRS